MTCDNPLLGVGIVPAQAIHLALFRFGVYGESSMIRGPVTTVALGRPTQCGRPAEGRLCSAYQPTHPHPEALLPHLGHLLRLPLPFAQKPRYPTKTAFRCHIPSQSAQCFALVAFHQPQEYDDKVLSLALTDTRTECFPCTGVVRSTDIQLA